MIAATVEVCMSNIVLRCASMGLCFLVGIPLLQAQTVGFCSVPTVLHPATPFATYSPEICIQYSGLQAQIYTVRVILLETQTGGFQRGTNQWAAEGSSPPSIFTIDNSSGTNSTGQMTLVRNM